MALDHNSKTATLYRMVMPDHLCPFGLKSKDLLERQGFIVEDHPLTTQDETEAFKKEHGVETTPQTFIDGDRIGGYEDLRAHFGKEVKDADETSYGPVVAIFSVAFLMALSVSWYTFGTVFSVRTVEWFIAISMCILAIQKLQDIESFSTMFLNYDLLARRWVRYGYIYPFGEALAGVLMIAGALIWIASPVALFIGTVGAASVFKAVYIDRRELKCACVGGSSNVPLGFVSLTENLMMIAMAIWMPIRMLWLG
ncbi:glutaredoxin family protein [Ectothiorhodospira lacustris]|uniref:glutaredoxin family protein n=1 Tax=Ectothiorhodospira lacustris TaxID=2899127 RepID=UPI001EE94FF0|nr:glutaredoxin family protein [Ectothiorhodospira lacustris]MCG5499396.1 glutaredoxin [Ectothiorhodospira lacustris]MCG5511299.1 glutaredoxin [Ectothiorhodospira lacustris]MCG5523027.1 glutaredoxin [Ectothiorhodospira lacustris]